LNCLSNFELPIHFYKKKKSEFCPFQKLAGIVLIGEIFHSLN